MNLKEKLQNWSEKALRGEDDYEITFVNDGYLFCKSGGYRDEINYFKYMIWKNRKMYSEYSWRKNGNDSVPMDICLVTKKDEKLLCYLKKEGKIFDFGFNKQESCTNNSADQELILIYYGFDDYGSLIIASNKTSEIRKINYVMKSSGNDVVKMLLELIENNTIQTPMDIKTKEDNKDE